MNKKKWLYIRQTKTKMKDLNDKDWKWNSLSIKERLSLIEKWEKEDAYPYGNSNARKRVAHICNHYLLKHIYGLNPEE
tara:strand:+ start:1675 stop:1908 length:234 start_codon:yes stop_codon:yes gene_type:complete